MVVLRVCLLYCRDQGEAIQCVENGGEGGGGCGW